MASERPPGLISQFLKTFIGSIGLVFFPLPVGIFRRQLAGKRMASGQMEFYSHPDLVCTMHLIWIGWLVALVAFYDSVALDREWWRVPAGVTAGLDWTWLVVLMVTFIIMGLQFGRVALGFLIAAISMFLMGLWLLQVLSQREVFGGILRTFNRIPVVFQWGVPMIVSLVLGLTFAAVAAWRRLNDRWILKPVGNYLEHENFQEKDRTISKGAKTFVAVFPCLIRHYLLFGYGNIEVRSSTGERILDRIEGVLFARQHADIIRTQFATTDIQSSLAEAEEAQEEEEVADEAL